LSAGPYSWRRSGLTALAALGVAALGVAIALTAPDRGGGRATAAVPGPDLPVLRPERSPLRPDRRGVPVLMYHEIARPNGGPIYSGLFVRPRTFIHQLRWLARHRFRAVTLARVEAAWAGCARLPGRPVVISFDDGYRGVYEHAFRWMRRHRWPGVLNLAAGNLAFAGGLSRRRVRRLIRNGWELASHTIHHERLPGRSRAMLRAEVLGSRRLLRRMFGAPVRNFAYPEGRRDARSIRAVRAAGYDGAMGIRPGLARPSERYDLDRIRIDDADGVHGVRAKLRSQGLP
jgi:peptidoglycan/xylan/chitin deacetylase (PgdA/CDA1 family)